MSSPGPRKFRFYHYDPSLVAAAVFTALFFLSSVLHTWQMARTKTWYFAPFVLGCIFEVVGYSCRIVGALETPDWTRNPYIIQTIFILIAPALMAAGIYMTLGRIILVTQGEQYSLIRRTWLTKIFVLIDVFSFVIQGGGAGIITNATTISRTNLGKNIILVGLFVQIVGFAAFFLTAVKFHYSLARDTQRAPTPYIPWKKHLTVLYAACIIIFIRSIFRVIEYIQGPEGLFFAHEYYLYVFDSGLMFAVVVMFHFVHPSEIKAVLSGGPQTRKKKVWEVKQVKAMPLGSAQGSAYNMNGREQMGYANA